MLQRLEKSLIKAWEQSIDAVLVGEDKKYREAFKKHVCLFVGGSSVIETPRLAVDAPSTSDIDYYFAIDFSADNAAQAFSIKAKLEKAQSALCDNLLRIITSSNIAITQAIRGPSKYNHHIEAKYVDEHGKTQDIDISVSKMPEIYSNFQIIRKASPEQIVF